MKFSEYQINQIVPTDEKHTDVFYFCHLGRSQWFIWIFHELLQFLWMNFKFSSVVTFGGVNKKPSNLIQA